MGVVVIRFGKFWYLKDLLKNTAFVKETNKTGKDRKETQLRKFVVKNSNGWK